MKKLVLSLMVFVGSLTFAQEYYDTYPEYNGTEYYNDSYNYPEDYYYNYPNDYYPDNYYSSYYNDYTRSITSVNWNRFFAEYNLSPWQINQVIALNNRFSSYDSWNMYYRMNPDRWYYDRFYALQNILGQNLFMVYERNYYRGNPIVYFQNYRRNYYVVNYNVIPKYRYVNVKNYRIDRNNFRQYYQNNRLEGMLDTRDSSAGIRNNQNSGFKNNAIASNSGIRNNESSSNAGIRTSTANTIKTDNGGFRTNNSNQNGGVRTSSNNVVRNDSGGFRTNNSGQSSGVRVSNNTSVRTDNSGFRNTERVKEMPRAENNSGSRSNGEGFRKSNSSR